MIPIHETKIPFSIGNIVANDYRSADVFKKYRIDFCCKGNRLLEDVCKEKNLNLETIEQELERATESIQPLSENDYKTMPIQGLVEHIFETHHAYVRQSIPILLSYLTKLCKVHGERHPELFDIYEEFNACATELTHHMVKEENILFPSINKMAMAKENGEEQVPFFFGALSNPIGMMQNEHSTEGDRFEHLAILTNNFTAPADGCTTYMVAFQKLQEFRDDLFMHIHLENNVLFPKALEMEAYWN